MEDCRLLRGPARLSMIGPATLLPAGAAGDISVLWNRDGKPSLETPVFPAPANKNTSGAPSLFPKKSAPESSANSTELLPQSTQDKALTPACAAAGSFAYCMNREGLIHRTTLRGDGEVFIAKGRAGTPFSVASYGVGHTFVAFLANQKTTEGYVTQAFAVLDQGPAVLLSEEGSGATFVSLIERQHDVVAMYIDARVAMTPMHARPLSSEGGKIKLGRDSVVYVGDGSDRRSSGAIAWTGKGSAYFLMPTTSLEGKFGVVAVRVDDEPKDDAPSVHAPYAKEIRPSPVAATVGVTPMRVLRVRPASAEAEAWKVLELGHLDDGGVFKPLCSLLESRSFSELSIAVDAKGSVWIAYASADGMWIEQRGKGL